MLNDVLMFGMGHINLQIRFGLKVADQHHVECPSAFREIDTGVDEENLRDLALQFANGLKHLISLPVRRVWFQFKKHNVVYHVRSPYIRDVVSNAHPL